MKILFLLSTIYLTVNKCVYIKLRFNKYSNYKEGTNYFDYLEKNDIFIILEIGTPPQEIPIFFDFESYPFYISNLFLNGTYNENRSSTFKYKGSKKESNFYGEIISQGYEVMDKIKLLDIKNKNIEINDFNYILPTKLNKNKDINFKTSIIGLKIQEAIYLQKNGFIHQLKQNNIIDSYSWTIKYINDNEGEIIIGGYPHEYDNNYDEKDFKNTKAEIRYSTINWDLLFDSIISKNIEMENRHVELDINLGFVRGINSYQKFLDEQFFNLKKNCKKLNNTKYFYYTCDGKEKISDFPTLTLNHKELNYTFELNYKDLFILKDNIYYCLIIFDNSNKMVNWRMGKPFFKKYQLSFESDRKLIVFYIRKKRINILWIIIIFLIIVIIVLIILMIRKYLNMPRKIRANELNDDFEYLVQDKDKKTIN